MSPRCVACGRPMDDGLPCPRAEAGAYSGDHTALRVTPEDPPPWIDRFAGAVPVARPVGWPGRPRVPRSH